MKGEEMKSDESSKIQIEKILSTKDEIINVKRNIALIAIPFIFLAIYYLIYTIFHKSWHLKKLDYIEYVLYGCSFSYIIFLLIKERQRLGLDLFLIITFCLFVIISFFNSAFEQIIYLKNLEILVWIIQLIIPIVILTYIQQKQYTNYLFNLIEKNEVIKTKRWMSILLIVFDCLIVFTVIYMAIRFK
jgi:hypothetical protein